MTLYLSNRDGNGKTSEEGHYKFPVNAYTGNVLTLTDLAVTEQTIPNLSVKIAPGQFRIPDTTGLYAYTGWLDVNTTVTVSAADPSNPRLSAIVLYVDKAASTSAVPPNNPGIVKTMSVNGTPNVSPVIPNGATIQAAVGAGNPYIVLATARVNAAGTTITNALITDLRLFVEVAPNLVTASSIKDLAVGTAELAAGAVTSAKIATNGVDTTNINALAVTTAKLAANAVTAAKIETQQAYITPSLQNSWVNYDAFHQPIGYMKDSLGFVHLRGLARSGTSGNIFVLPVGMRSLWHGHFPAVSNGTFCYIRIDISGQVAFSGYTNTWASLDGVTFFATA